MRYSAKERATTLKKPLKQKVLLVAGIEAGISWLDY